MNRDYLSNYELHVIILEGKTKNGTKTGYIHSAYLGLKKFNRINFALKFLREKTY